VAGATVNYPTAPSSRPHRPDTYTTKPGSAQLFPTLFLPSGELCLPEHDPIVDIDQRALMMPRRKPTCVENLARIEAERKLNDDHVAERNKPPPF